VGGGGNWSGRDYPVPHAKRSADCGARREWIALDFPATPDVEVDPPDGLLDALGIAATYVGKSRFDYLVELADHRKAGRQKGRKAGRQEGRKAARQQGGKAGVRKARGPERHC
jgi:hypothetical protein